MIKRLVLGSVMTASLVGIALAQARGVTASGK
jgi:hypothetical protein